MDVSLSQLSHTTFRSHRSGKRENFPLFSINPLSAEKWNNVSCGNSLAKAFSFTHSFINRLNQRDYLCTQNERRKKIMIISTKCKKKVVLFRGEEQEAESHL